MRIGIDFHVDTHIYQGTKTYLGQLVEALASFDRDDLYFLFNAHYERSPLSMHTPNFIRQPLVTNSGKYNLLMGFAREAHRNRLDLFHTNYLTPIGMPCKTVVTIHDILFEILPEFFPPFHRRIQKLFTSRLARRADAVITVSQFSRNLLLELYGLDPSKVFVTLEAASSFFRPLGKGGEKVLRKYGIHDDFILYVGRIAPIKNIPGMLEAFVEVRAKMGGHLQFVLVGQRDPIFREHKIENHLKELGILDSVIFLNGIVTSDLVWLYNRAQVLFFVSYGEGFGLPILEAMACGTPVITSNTTACDEIAGDAALKVCPGDKEAAVHALTCILEDTELRKSLKQKGLLHAAKFSWDICAKMTLDIYKSCVEAR